MDGEAGWLVREGLRLISMPVGNDMEACRCQCTCEKQEDCESVRENVRWCQHWAFVQWAVTKELSPPALESALESCLRGCGQKRFWAMPRREGSRCWTYRIILFVGYDKVTGEMPSLFGFDPRVTKVDGLSFRQKKCFLRPVRCCQWDVRYLQSGLDSGPGAGAAAGFGNGNLLEIFHALKDVRVPTTGESGQSSSD